MSIIGLNFPGKYIKLWMEGVNEVPAPFYYHWSTNTMEVTAVLKGHLWDKEKWPYKIGDLLKEVQFIWNFLWQDKKNVTF